MDVHIYQPFKSIFSYEEKSQRQVTWTADGNQVSETRHLKSLYRRNLDIFSEWLRVPGQCQSMSCRGMTVSWQWVKAIKLHGNECRSRRPVFCDQRRKIAKALFLVWWWRLLSVLWWFAFSVVFWCFALFVVVFDVLLSLLCFWRFAFFVGVFGVMLSFLSFLMFCFLCCFWWRSLLALFFLALMGVLPCDRIYVDGIMAVISLDIFIT